MSDGMKKIIESFRLAVMCGECEGYGSKSTPSNYGPCDDCDGTGFTRESSCNDLFNDLKKQYE